MSWRGRLGPLIPTASLRPRENPAQEGAVDALRAHRHFLKQEDICSKQDQETARQKRMTIRGEGLLLDLAFLGSSLCGEKNREQVELMQLNRGETGCAEYLAKLSPKEMLEAKLHEAIRVAKGQVERESKN